jgi:hypothetical protein
VIPGISISIGEEQFILPPLGLEGLRKTADIQARFAEMSIEERLDANIEIVHSALIRNYPDLTLDEMRAKIHAWELTELVGVLPALYEKQGFKGKKQK